MTVPAGRKVCPVPDCENVIACGFTACAGHYLALSKADRAVLAEAFRRREQDPAVFRLAVTLARELVLQQARRTQASNRARERLGAA